MLLFFFGCRQGYRENIYFRERIMKQKIQKAFVRTASELNPKKVNILLLEDFGRLVNAIARTKDIVISNNNGTLFLLKPFPRYKKLSQSKLK